MSKSSHWLNDTSGSDTNRMHLAVDMAVNVQYRHVHTICVHIPFDSLHGTGIVKLTECSKARLRFTLLEDLNLQSDYTFFAACNTDNGTCVSEKTN